MFLISIFPLNIFLKMKLFYKRDIIKLSDIVGCYSHELAQYLKRIAKPKRHKTFLSNICQSSVMCYQYVS